MIDNRYIQLNNIKNYTLFLVVIIIDKDCLTLYNIIV